MNQLIPANFGQISSRFAQTPVADDLSSGIQSSFGLIGYKGKVWSIRYRGDETALMRDDGDGPRASIEVVIAAASPAVSKVWYENGYVEGSTAAPDCFSNNGVTPDATSAKKQCDTCALCPHNQWGSRITPAGKSGKSCADSKRLAVVPAGDINNEVYGGPMLLRVPAASLQDLAMFGQKMQQMGYPYYSIATKIAFDPTEAFPKFVFSGLRPLTDDEADIVISMRDSHQVKRILSENEFGTPVNTEQAKPAEDKPLFEQAPGVGARQETPQQTSTVGDQARAAAAKQAAVNQPKPQPAQNTQPAQTQQRTVEPVKTVQPEPTPAAPAEQTVAINPRYVAFLKAGLTPEQAKATIEAMGETIEMAAAPVTTESNAVVTPEPEKAPAKRTTKPKAEPAQEQVEEQTMQGEEDNAEHTGVAQPSDFEENLDAMLKDLLPTL